MRKINAWLFRDAGRRHRGAGELGNGRRRHVRSHRGGLRNSDALLLGRRTYETFAASWPERGSEVPNADWMNNTRKYVASTTLRVAGVAQLHGDRGRRRRGRRAPQAGGRQEHTWSTAAARSSGRLCATICSTSFGSSCTRSSWGSGIAGCSTTRATPVELALVDSHAYENGVDLPHLPTRRAPRTPTRPFEGSVAPAWTSGPLSGEPSPSGNDCFLSSRAGRDSNPRPSDP